MLSSGSWLGMRNYKVCNTNLPQTPRWTTGRKSHLDFLLPAWHIYIILQTKSNFANTIICVSEAGWAWNVPRPGVPAWLWLRPGHVEPMPPTRDAPSSKLDCIFATGDKNTGGKVEQSAEWSSSGNFINGAAKLRHATRTLIMRKTCDVAIKLFVLLLYTDTGVWPDLAGAWRQAHYELWGWKYCWVL